MRADAGDVRDRLGDLDGDVEELADRDESTLAMYGYTLDDVRPTDGFADVLREVVSGTAGPQVYSGGGDTGFWTKKEVAAAIACGCEMRVVSRSRCYALLEVMPPADPSEYMDPDLAVEEARIGSLTLANADTAGAEGERS
jgi:hypothetical protein